MTENPDRKRLTQAWKALFNRHGKSALDVGCGPGHIAKLMADTGAKVTGVDLSPEMVKVARGLFPHIEFEEASAEDLPFDGDRFDAVLVNFAIHTSHTSHCRRERVGKSTAC